MAEVSAETKGMEWTPGMTLYPRRWQMIDGQTARLPVPGGWLVKGTEMLTLSQAPPPSVLNAEPIPYAISLSTALVFISDPKHEWELVPVPKPAGGDGDSINSEDKGIAADDGSGDEPKLIIEP